jgi:predicted DNA-binding transcriptional regulator AlpA
MTHAEVAATLSISVTALWSLSGNPQFPAPVSNDGAGNILWDSTAISTFAALQASALGRGWKISTAALPDVRFRSCLGEQSWRVLSTGVHGPAVRRLSDYSASRLAKADNFLDECPAARAAA